LEFCHGLGGNVYGEQAAERASLYLLKVEHFRENRNFTNPSLRGDLNMVIPHICPVIQIERYKSSFYTKLTEENIADYGCHQETDSAATQTVL
jgi:hypothetical protein